MITVKDIRVRSFDIDYLDVYWSVDTNEDLQKYAFIVQKAYNQFGPFNDITGQIRDRFHLRDNTVTGQHSFYTKIYYRIKVVVRDPNDSTEYLFPDNGAGVCLAAEPDLAALEMARINRLKLQEFSGRKLWIYPKRTFGQRCGCFDPVTSRKLRSSCTTCYDTGWVGGYEAPVETYGLVVTPNEQVAHTPIGNAEVENTTILLPNYPEIAQGWIIVEAENIRWRVGDTVTKVRKARSLIRQQAQIHRVPKGDVEYSLPLNISSPENLVASPSRNYTNPQTLDSNSQADPDVPDYVKN